MTILLEYIIATAGLLAGGFGSIFTAIFVFRADMFAISSNFLLYLFIALFLVTGGPLALLLYSKRRGETFRIWPVIKWQAFGFLAAGIYLMVLQSTGLLNTYSALLMNLIPGVFTVASARRMRIKTAVSG